MDVAVFTYGTLQSDAVLQAVLGRVPHRVRGTLHGYSRHPILGQCYPAVTPCRDASVTGYLLLQLSPAELLALDAFEDPAYERVVSPVKVDAGDADREQEQEQVMARVWARAHGNTDDLDMDNDWKYEEFVAVHGDRYVRRCENWAIHYKMSL